MTYVCQKLKEYGTKNTKHLWSEQQADTYLTVGGPFSRTLSAFTRHFQCCLLQMFIIFASIITSDYEWIVWPVWRRWRYAPLFNFICVIMKHEAIPCRVSERIFLSDLWFVKQINFTFGNSVVLFSIKSCVLHIYTSEHTSLTRIYLYCGSSP
jgi:hypothetical protein